MIKLIAVGKLKEQYLVNMVEDYKKRINKYHAVVSMDIVYQRQYITSSKNFIYYVTVSSSDEDSLDSEEIKNVLNSFKIKDELIERQPEYLKYYICLGGIVIFGISILILSIKTTKTENNTIPHETEDKKTRKATKKQK